MNEKHDRTWRELAQQTRKGERHIIHGEAAERLLWQLPDTGLAESDIEAIVDSVFWERPLRDVRGDAPNEEVGHALETEAVEEDVLQLNRNRGEESAEAELLVDKLRREALEDDEGV